MPFTLQTKSFVWQPRGKMASRFQSLIDSARNSFSGNSTPAPPTPIENTPAESLFPKVDPAIDGEDCDHDCDSCHIKYPKGFKIDEEDSLYGHINEWSTHVLVATGKTDWVRDVADEEGSVMEAIGKKADVKPTNGVSSADWIAYNVLTSTRNSCFLLQISQHHHIRPTIQNQLQFSSCQHLSLSKM